MKNKIIYISGANITIGGPLEIYRNVLNSLNFNYPKSKVIAIVSDKKLFEVYDNVEFIEIKRYKQFILFKFYYEYINYYFISKKEEIDLWFSLNDCTPSVKAKNRVVYCHNATPFYRKTINDFFYPTRAFLQSFYYELFFFINIKKNTFVVVQQKWIKKYFNTKFKIPNTKIIISRYLTPNPLVLPINENIKSNIYTFIYPTKAQPYKNIEVILDAIVILKQKGNFNFRVLLTIDSRENRYANKLYNKYSHLKCVFWIGYVSKLELNKLYAESNCLIFSSKLETWGLPISEFKTYNKPILAVDLPYARETVGDFKLASFFDQNNSAILANQMIDAIENRLEFENCKSIVLEQPYAIGIENLLQIVLNE